MIISREMKRFFITAFILLVIVMAISTHVKEGFEGDFCAEQRSCSDCTQTSGCSWCSRKNICINSTMLKLSDIDCNQNNTFTSSTRCPNIIDDKIPPEAVVSNDIMYDYALYKNQITDRIPPPNVYTTNKMEYSPETVMGQLIHVENQIKNNQANLPTIIATTVQDNIRPMVKGLLSEPM